MNIFLGIAIILVIIVIWFIWQRSKRMRLLQAKVVALNPKEYCVTYQELHPETKPIEYVWLCILFAAKLLYIIGNDPNQSEAKSMLNELIRVLGDTDISDKIDIISNVNRPIQVVEGTAPAGKTIIAKTAYVNPMSRLIWTSIPLKWFQYQFPDTFLAVVHTTIPKLDQICKKRLQQSLARMAELYATGADSATLTALNEVPYHAFIEPKISTNP